MKQRQGRIGDARPQDRIVELPCPSQSAASLGEDLDRRFAVIRDHASGDILDVVICHRSPGRVRLRIRHLRLPNSWTRCAQEVLADDTKWLRANTYDSIGGDLERSYTDGCPLHAPWFFTQSRRAAEGPYFAVTHRGASAFWPARAARQEIHGRPHGWPPIPISLRLRVSA
jgi:hypothetical protein